MNIADKVTATKRFQQFGLEGVPARIYSEHFRPALGQLVEDFGAEQVLMVRTAAPDETRNLPRLAGATLDRAAAWIDKLPVGLTIIVQPYDRVIFSVELAVYDDEYVAELIPGIWELGTNLTPTAVQRGSRDVRSVSWTLQNQPASFHSAARGYYVQRAHIADWQISALISWERKHRESITQIATEFARPLGIKLHYAASYGLSPQNIRTSVPGVDAFASEPIRENVVQIATLTEEVPVGGPVLLAVSVAREAHSQLEKLISRMVAAQVQTVYLRSGLLSHLAIILREAGFTVRRFDGSILCD